MTSSWQCAAPVRELKGPNAIVAISQEHPDRLVAARLGYAGGVTIGYGADEMYVASDVPALLGYTRRVAFLETGQVAVITQDRVRVTWLDGGLTDVTPVTVHLGAEQVQRGRYRHFMEKEIYEQPESLTATLRGRLDTTRNRVVLDSLGMSEADAARVPRITIVACGTSYYAGLVGKHYVERLARIPVEVEYASEYRTRDPIVTPGSLCSPLPRAAKPRIRWPRLTLRARPRRAYGSARERRGQPGRPVV